MKSFSQVFEAKLREDKDGVLAGFDTQSFRDVLKLLDENRKICEEEKLTPASEKALDLMKWKIIGFEEKQTEPRFLRWNVTAYAPKGDDKEFAYQFCSRPPDCSRIFLSFKEGEATMSISPPCVKKPTPEELKAIHASIGSGDDRKETAITLEQTLRELKESKIQVVAVTGFARNFPYHDPDADKDLGPEELKKKALYQHRADYASQAIDSFMSQYESLNLAFTTVNGGWAGQEQKPREAGITFMGHLHGVVHEGDDAKKQKGVHKDRPLGGFFPPLTVMPRGGSSDSVTMASSHPGFVKSAAEEKEKKVKEEAKIESIMEETVGSRSQFIIEGDWGSDSPYLAALCTSMIVIEPAGRWTQIEMLNALAQDRPVVILASPENFDKDWMKDWGEDNKTDPQYAGLARGEPFVEIALPTKNNPNSTIRAYSDPVGAANYLAWRYEVDHIPANWLRTHLKSEHGQHRLQTLIQELSRDIKPDDIKPELIDANEAKEIAKKLLHQTHSGNPESMRVIADSIKGLSKKKAIEKLSLWQSPDKVNTMQKEFTPHYLTGTQPLWSKPTLATPPTPSSSLEVDPKEKKPPTPGKSGGGTGGGS